MSENTVVKTEVKQRNYQLDFIKLLCTVCVFVVHTYRFIGENTKFKIPLGMNWWSVHLFFIISGLLMVNSFFKRNENGVEYGKQAINFVLHKFKSLAMQYWVALFIAIIIYIYIWGSVFYYSSNNT